MLPLQEKTVITGKGFAGYLEAIDILTEKRA